ncbi:peptide-methionine (S)-S-oxide reductase [Candidatus Microgenomates bacterium]|nr:MAG: peptide-methionine (S)-S-oxide reductase [Candidatus Microgenomates bacterium]
MQQTIEQTATFGGGCFWCTEAIFQRLKGITSVTSGYMGGHVPNPTSQRVYTGTTGHAEVVQITFNPKIIRFNNLLEVFFATHDPTSFHQGADVGEEYRSVIFYHNEKQKQAVESMIKKLQLQYRDKIVTEVVSASKFYPAETYHQDFYNKNKQYPYCQLVIDPKLKKLLKEYGKLVREDQRDI